MRRKIHSSVFLITKVLFGSRIADIRSPESPESPETLMKSNFFSILEK